MAPFFTKNDLFQDIEFGIDENIRVCCVINQKLFDNLLHGQPYFFTRCFDLNEPTCFLRKSFFHDPNSCEVGTLLKFQGFWNQTVHFMFACNPSCMRKVFCEITSCLCAIPDVQGVL